MAQFTVEIPNALLPALVAEFFIVSNAGGTNATSPEEYFQASVVEIVRQRAEAYGVGPYWKPAQPPRFNQDGTPYKASDGDGGNLGEA